MIMTGMVLQKQGEGAERLVFRQTGADTAGELLEVEATYPSQATFPPIHVRSVLVGHSPDAVRTHWVDVDGVHWPPGQVLALATGADRRRTTSRCPRWSSAACPSRTG